MRSEKSDSRWSPSLILSASFGYEVSGDAQVPPFPVGFHAREVRLLNALDGIAAEQQTQRRFVKARNVNDSRCCPNRIAGLPAIIVALETRTRTDSRVILGTTLTNPCRRTRKVGTKTARLNNGDLDA